MFLDIDKTYIIYNCMQLKLVDFLKKTRIYTSIVNCGSGEMVSGASGGEFLPAQSHSRHLPFSLDKTNRDLYRKVTQLSYNRIVYTRRRTKELTAGF